MSRTLTFSIGALLCLVGSLFFLITPVAQAQGGVPGGDAANCLACHEDLYYLRDTGKWHCLCAASPTCLHCHGGQPGVMTAAEAHAGMIANPLQENAAVCQQCHCQDCETRVAEFLAVAGGTLTEGRGQVFPTLTPVLTPPAPAHQAYRWPEHLRTPWRQAALGLTAVALAALAVWAIVLWRSERQPGAATP